MTSSGDNRVLSVDIKCCPNVGQKGVTNSRNKHHTCTLICFTLKQPSHAVINYKMYVGCWAYSIICMQFHFAIDFIQTGFVQSRKQIWRLFHFNFQMIILHRWNNLCLQVQAVYQSCSGSSGTCACAVAVLFGNDVFVLDKCRRKKPSCDVTGCDRLVRSILYQNGDITPNTRIYRKYDGLKFQVNINKMSNCIEILTKLNF